MAECKVTMSILDHTENIIGPKAKMYDYEDNLDDDLLRLIMNPMD